MRGLGWRGAVGLGLASALVWACGGDDRAELPAPMVAEKADSPLENHAPSIRGLRLDPVDPLDGDTLRASVQVEDREGDAVELGFVWWVRGHRQATGEASLLLEGVSRGDEIEVEVTPSDGQRVGEKARSSVVVRNQPPVVLGIAIRPEAEVARGDPVVASFQGRDPDGDSLRFKVRWEVNGEPVIQEGPEFDTASLARGDEIRAIVVANDGEVDSAPLESVVVQVANAHPVIHSNPVGMWEDGAFRYEIEARDPDSRMPLRYALRSGPDGMQIDPVLGSVTWAPRPDQKGRHVVEVAVSDSLGATSVQTFELDVNVVEPAKDEPPPASTPPR